eukprot:RCo037973
MSTPALSPRNSQVLMLEGEPCMLDESRLEQAFSALSDGGLLLRGSLAQALRLAGVSECTDALALGSLETIRAKNGVDPGREEIPYVEFVEVFKALAPPTSQPSSTVGGAAP